MGDIGGSLEHSLIAGRDINQTVNNVLVVLDRYQSGQLAGAEAKAVADLALQQVTATNPVIAQGYQKNPTVYELPLVDALSQLLEVDRGLAARLEALLERYEAAGKQSQQATLSGHGSLAQGEGSTAVSATGGGIAIGGSVGGDLIREQNIYPPAVPGPEPGNLRQAYLNHLFEVSSRLSLAGVDPKAASNEAEARLNLGAVYTALLTLSPEHHERLLLGDLSGREVRRLPALKQLNRHASLVLLGDPGSGKSTFVNFVAMCLAGETLGRAEANLALLTAPLPDDKGQDQEEVQPWTHQALLPVRVILRDFAARGLPEPGQPAAARHLWDFIVGELAAVDLEDYAPHLRQELMGRGGLLLLDGLDEVPEANRRRVQLKEVVESFAATYPHCRILVTSRTYAYQKQEWRLPGFSEVVLAPFSQGQIRRFVDRWYAHIAGLRGLHRDDAQGRAEILKRAIFGSERLEELAVRPLLLTLMSSLHAWRGGSLPEKREELYADTVDLLLDWWESPKTVRDEQGQVVVLQPSLAEWLKVDRDKVRAQLNALAYQAHSDQPELVGTADVDEGQLVSGLMRLSRNPEVNPARLVEYLSQRAGLLLPRGVGVYTIPHRTFQEYLAACYLTDYDYPDQVAELARSEPERWREVALLAGAKGARGSASTIWQLVEALCYREPQAEECTLADVWGAHLAGQALVETANLEQVSERNQRKVERVQHWLVEILAQDELPALERVAAGVTLAHLGDDRPGVGLRSDGLPDVAWCHIPTGPFLMGSDKTTDGQAYGVEMPQHQVDLPAFRIGQYPVTNTQYRAFVEDGGYTRKWRQC
jgi:predicted ATPase